MKVIQIVIMDSNKGFELTMEDDYSSHTTTYPKMAVEALRDVLNAYKPGEYRIEFLT